MIQFERDEFLFNRFISETCSYQSNIRSLKVIGTDQGRAIYNGFLAQIPELKLLLCVFHLEKGDRKKLLQFNTQKGAVERILADVYGCHYGAFREYGLANSKGNKDFAV